MMGYAWFDTQHGLTEVKFGDHFVPEDMSAEDAAAHTIRYVRSQFPRRATYFDTTNVEKAVWDISDIAKAQGKFYPHSHIDDVVRTCIPGKPGTQGREFHATTFDAAVHAVNTYIARSKQALPVVSLTQWQHDDVSEVVLEIAAGKRTILAELCARYGKTLWAGALTIETGARITIIASYVLSSFSSFAKDLSRFEQFRKLELVDAASSDYEQKVQDALDEGRQVLVFMSMCGGGKRQERLDFLFDLPHSRLVIIDEADYGAHQKNQCDPFIAARQPNDVVILMTGTNGDRACGSWKIDHYLSKTYAELVMVKRGHIFGSPKWGCRHFTVDATRHQLTPTVEFYQLGLSALVQTARKLNPELFVDGDDRLPSWSKFAKNPIRAQGFFTQLLQAVLLGQHSHDELNVLFQTNGKLSKHRVAMMFLSGSMRNEALADTVTIAQLALPGWKIIEISGQTTTNAKAEQQTKKEIEEARERNIPVLILSRGMAQRSYSIGEISELYLCYDGGDVGATTQKMSRALTAQDADKIGRIFSLSFDPNRDDKFDCALLAAAQNFKKANNIDIVDALRAVISTLDIFSCQTEGSVKIDLDNYLCQVLERNSLGRMVGRQANIDEMDEETLRLLADGEASYDQLKKTEATEKGKTSAVPAKKATKAKSVDDEKTMNDLKKRARETVVAIVEHMPYLMFGTNANTIREALEACEADAEHREYVVTAFNVTPKTIHRLFDQGVLNYDLASLQRTAKLASLRN
jgi:hypothetical protein